MASNRVERQVLDSRYQAPSTAPRPAAVRGSTGRDDEERPQAHSDQPDRSRSEQPGPTRHPEVRGPSRRPRSGSRRCAARRETRQQRRSRRRLHGELLRRHNVDGNCDGGTPPRHRCGRRCANGRALGTRLCGAWGSLIDGAGEVRRHRGEIRGSRGTAQCGPSPIKTPTTT